MKEFIFKEIMFTIVVYFQRCFLIIFEQHLIRIISPKTHCAKHGSVDVCSFLSPRSNLKHCSKMAHDKYEHYSYSADFLSQYIL